MRHWRSDKGLELLNANTHYEFTCQWTYKNQTQTSGDGRADDKIRKNIILRAWTESCCAQCVIECARDGLVPSRDVEPDMINKLRSNDALIISRTHDVKCTATTKTAWERCCLKTRWTHDKNILIVFKSKSKVCIGDGYQNLEPEIILVALSLEVLLEIMSKHMVHSLRRSESCVLQ